MKRSTKAVLLSAFAGPGAGQIYLKRPIVAAVLIGISVIALILALIPAFGAATEIAERIEAGELALGPDLLVEVTALAQDATSAASGPGLVLLLVWLVGVVHAWLVGRAQPDGDTAAA